MIRLVFPPRSLFGRLILLLLFGLILAQAITAVVLTRDRGEAVWRATGAHSAQRIAGIVRVLEPMDETRRRETALALDAPGMRVGLQAVDPENDPQPPSARSALFLSMLRYYLDDDREIRLSDIGAGSAQPFRPHERGGANQGMGRMMRQHMGGAGPGRSVSPSYLVQVRLHDGAWVSFGERLPEEIDTWPLRVVITLVLVLSTLSLVAFFAVRWLTRPLSYLAASARALGRNLQRPPLKVEGPDEVRSTLEAFNTMQAQIREFVEERSRFLAAVSHDMKTPITRLRLRAGLLEDAALQAKFERDLEEMEALVQGTLEFMRGVNSSEGMSLVDINDLLETLQIDAEEAGQRVTLTGRTHAPLKCHPVAMRRAVGNLLDNAVKYAGGADIGIQDSEQRLLITVADDGPGIPEEKLEAVFQPFTRLEDSRSRDTGGTGLGLSIARNIARAHGGELSLRNGEQGGLVAELVFPRRRS